MAQLKVGPNVVLEIPFFSRYNPDDEAADLIAERLKKVLDG